ncbi:MAG: HDOD domain-containing protein [Chromatiales bacterium]|nr:HDOD domain-containing protein [Chromatiales bacterium]
MANSPKNLAQWVTRLNEEEMPIFSHTVNKIAEISQQSHSSVAELTQVILQDSTMTARVLRFANSVFFRPTGAPITTVSRAVVVLGFDSIRNITLSIAIVDSLLNGKSEDRVMLELARSFHAAVQAKVFAVECGDDSPEEVFIAALLQNIGHMVFWCFPYGMDEALHEELALSDGDDKLAEKRVLGFTLDELTVALNREWHLSPVLEEYVKGGRRKSVRSKIMDLSWKTVTELENGWDSSEVDEIFGEVSKLLSINPEQCNQMISDNAHVARHAAASCGATVAGQLIPLPPTEEEIEESREQAAGAEPDYLLQLSILRELSAMLNEKIDINAMMGMVLEGIYRGLGMDRAWFALLLPTSHSLTIKYALGDERDEFQGTYLVEPGGRKSNIFTDSLSMQKPQWHKSGGPMGELPKGIRKLVGTGDFFLMPIVIDGSPKGLFFADRGQSGRELNDEIFMGFKHFCEQAAIGLSVMSHTRGR